MKISQRTTPAQATAALAVGLIAMPALMGASHPVTSHPTPSRSASAARASRAPGITISVGDGRTAARAGDELTYTVIVRNSGAVNVSRLKVTQTLSAGLQFVSASDDGAAASGHVSWSARLPVGGERTFRVVARVTRTPATLLRLAAVACATLPGASGPLVCSAHLDRLPAATAAAPASRSTGDVLPYTAAGVGVLALGLLTAVVARRRGRLRRQPA